MHESNYETAIRNVIDASLRKTGLNKKGYETVQEAGWTDIRVREYTQTRFVLEIKKTKAEVSRPKWWRRARLQATDSGAEYFGITNGELLILFRDRRGAEVGNCILRPGPISLGDYGTHGEADNVLNKLEQELSEVFTDLFVKGVAYEYEKSLDTLINKYNIAHRLLITELERELKSSLRNRTFEDEFLSWARSFSNKPEDPKNITIAAEECAHVILNRIIFYEILRNELNGINDEIKRERKIPRVPLSPIGDIQIIPVGKLFSEVGRLYRDILRIDYEQVFSTARDVLDKIPLNNAALTIISEFIEDLGNFSLTRDQFGDPAQLFSQMFERLIPIEKRHDYGQVFTEKLLVDVLCELCVKDRGSHILDPACGTGSFLDAAYDKIWALSQHEGVFLSHPQVLEHLHGIEISKFPMHLCTMRLALKDTTYVSNPDLKETDFFKVDPDNILGDKGVDVVLCNPPYLRQEVIPGTEKSYIRSRIRTHLRGLTPNGHYPYSPGRADKYFYFVEYSTPFLKRGGHAGWVLSDKFLVNTSGKELKKFLLDHYQILAMIKFGRRHFPDFMVDNCLAVLRRPTKGESPSETDTKFLKIKQEMSVRDIVRLASSGQETSNAIRRLAIKKQRELDQSQRWTDFFLDLTLLDRIRENKKVVPLTEVCVKRGIKRGHDDGCSEFFYPHKYLEDFEIDDFLVDGLKTSRDIETLILKSEDCECLLLIPPDTDLNAPENSGLKRFIEFARSDGFDSEYKDRTTKRYVRVPERTTVKNNSRRSGQPWYSFDPGTNDFDIIIPRMVRTYFKVLLTDAKPYLSTNFWGVKIKESDTHELDRFLVCAFLNSSLGEIQFENIGRNYVGLIKMEKPDIRDLFVIDPTSVSKPDKEEIRAIFLRLNKSFKTSDYQHIRKELDLKLLSILGLSGVYEDLIDTLDELKDARKKSGQV